MTSETQTAVLDASEMQLILLWRGLSEHGEMRAVKKDGCLVASEVTTKNQHRGAAREPLESSSATRLWE